MKLLTLRTTEGFHTGVLLESDVLDLHIASASLRSLGALPRTMRGLLGSLDANAALIQDTLGQLAHESVRETLLAKGALVPLSGLRLGPVVPDSDLVLAGSMNSRGHLAEMHDELPLHPCAFHKVRSALAASGDDILPPPDYAQMIDWEGEFCAVIGTRCHRVTPESALRYVAGFTLMNDISARDFVLPFVTAKGAAPTAIAWERNVLGKNFPTFCPIGPVIATRDEFSAQIDYLMETMVNGELVQSSTKADLVFGIAEMVSYFSTFYVFQPGDIISMGSPPGVGMARNPQRFLKTGDIVEVRVAEIGALQNRIGSVSGLATGTG